MAEEKETKKKEKRPSALKRDIQGERNQLRNRAFKSKVRTAVRIFEEALSTKQAQNASSTLNEVYSLMDKGVKKGIYKKNKADRTKARMAAKITSI